MKKTITLLAFCCCSLALVACAPAKKYSDASPQVVAEPDSVSAMLADAATRASNALETLAAAEQDRGPAIAAGPIGDAPPELMRALTLNWIGPVEPIAQKLAHRASYSFTTVGTPPAVPVVVSLDVENKPVIEILRDLGLQLGMRADIRVDSARRAVELHYSPNTGARG